MELGTRPTRGRGKNILYIALIILLIGGAIYLAPRFEWNAPQITLKLDSEHIGLRPLEVEVSERGTGLSRVSMTLSGSAGEQSLVDERYDTPIMQKTFSVPLAKQASAVKEGPAVLRLTARDRSYWSFFRGNQTVIEKKVVVDLTPPTVELISDDRYINLGGSGLVIYRASPDTESSGINIGNYFFPGYKGQVNNPDTYLVFFAHPYDVSPEEKTTLTATDKAGNSKQLAISYNLKNVRYRKSTLTVSDSFIRDRVAPLIADPSARQGSPKEVFIRVNRDLRKQNEEQIKKISEKSAPSMLWRGAFHQLRNSKVEANFADARTYVYQGEVIDHAYHLGYDLAVTQRHPIEAANHGIVVFTGDLGIYGNTVILDHGLGLFTLYAHMSSIDVKLGESVKQQQILGKTGETGLAVGDHLHYAILIHGVPVLPLEWWDGKWVKDNVLRRIEEAGGKTDLADQPISVAPRAKSR